MKIPKKIFFGIPFIASCTLFGDEITHGDPPTNDETPQIFQELALKENQDYADAQKGFLAPLPAQETVSGKANEEKELKISEIHKQKERKELSKATPSKQEKMVYKTGLFRLVEGIYQIRSKAHSNMTIIEGTTGIIVVDPLATNADAKMALDLYFKNRPQKPITHVIYTHSHVDHFGGVKGIISTEDVESGKTKVVAPIGFTMAALVENVMNVRASAPLTDTLFPLSSKTKNDSSLILPNELVETNGQKIMLDGVECVFVLASQTEATHEMLFYLPCFKAIYIGQDALSSLQNSYGANSKVCESKTWAKSLNHAIDMFGSKAQLVFGQHHNPKWGNLQVVEFLEKQRDFCKYVHDQTLRLANQGLTFQEIAEKIQLPTSLSKDLAQKGIKENLPQHTKAVYNHYLGWFDANSSDLQPVTSKESSKKYVEYMGGIEAILQKAEKDFAAGNYRWAVEVLNHIICLDPGHKKARATLADSLDKLGEETENNSWKKYFLGRAAEIREGVQKQLAFQTASPDMIYAMSTEMLMDYLAINLNGPKAAEKLLVMNFNLPDNQEKFVIEIKNGVLNYFPNKNREKVNATITINRKDFNDLVLGKTYAHVLKNAKKLQINGNEDSLNTFMSLLDPFDSWFNSPEAKRS